MKLPRPALSAFLVAGLVRAEAASLFTFGPMLHLDFGKGSWEYALGVEYAHWWTDAFGGGPMVGMDIGVDFTNTRVRLYTEAQSGTLIGASAGPYIEFPFGGGKKDYGFQASLWAAAFVGADMRVRYGTGGIALSPGVFAKVIGCDGGCGQPVGASGDPL